MHILKCDANLDIYLKGKEGASKDEERRMIAIDVIGQFHSHATRSLSWFCSFMLSLIDDIRHY